MGLTCERKDTILGGVVDELLFFLRRDKGERLRSQCFDFSVQECFSSMKECCRLCTKEIFTFAMANVTTQTDGKASSGITEGLNHFGLGVTR